MRFAMNHIAAPKLSLDEFFAMARRLGATEVEIRNDLPDIVGTMPPEAVKDAAEAAGVTILSINALYPFNVWSGDLPARTVALADYAAACGAQALVMCPLNDGTPVAQADLVAALAALAPILRDRGLTGLVEPLGFPVSSMRTKREALAAIDASGGADVYRLVHDTFHHRLAGETEVFPDRTGLVHISGVVDPGIAVADMLDAHRVLVDGADRLENLPQAARLLALGYAGPFSFEPFATEVHDRTDIEAALASSMAHVAQGIAAPAPRPIQPAAGS
ncbi:MAG: TIM barrel protein [Mangrovicoccus sp.]|nr:TIM barrel protein [Mangrovicoccus sp.]